MTSKFKPKQRVRLKQAIDRGSGDGNSQYLAAGAVGTVRSYIYNGKQAYGVEFDAVRDDPWYAGLSVTLTNVKTLDGQLQNVVDLCEPTETTS